METIIAYRHFDGGMQRCDMHYSHPVTYYVPVKLTRFDTDLPVWQDRHGYSWHRRMVSSDFSTSYHYVCNDLDYILKNKPDVRATPHPFPWLG